MELVVLTCFYALLDHFKLWLFPLVRAPTSEVLGDLCHIHQVGLLVGDFVVEHAVHDVVIVA